MATDIRIRLGLTGENEVNNGLRSITQGLDNIGGKAGFAVSGLAALGSALGVAFSARAIISAADAVTVLNNQLKLVTSSTKAAGQAYDELFNIAQRSRVSFTELGSTYASIARAGEQLGISQTRLLGVTEAISNAVTVSGGSAESAKAALVQLSQGLASGTLRGDELNSVMEQTPRLASALAAGLGVTTGELRKMGEQGQITADKVISALESQSATLKGEVASSVTTVGQAWTVLTNATVVAVGEIDKASGASATLADAMKSIASAVTTVGRAFKENEATISTVMGVIGGAAIAGGVALVATRVATLAVSVGSLAGAFTALNTALLANPVTLTLLGIGAVVGGGTVLYENRANSIDGLTSRVKDLNDRVKEFDDAIVADGGRTNASIEQRRNALVKLRNELQSKLETKTTAAASENIFAVSRSADGALRDAERIGYEKRLKLKKAFDLEYASSEQKAIAEIKRQRAEMGDLFTQADEAKIRANFVKTAAKPTPKADTYDTAAIKAYADVIGDLSKIENDAIGKTDELSQAQNRLRTAIASPEFAAFSRRKQEEVILAGAAAIAAEDQAAAVKSLAAEREKELAGYVKSAESANQKAQQLEDEVAAYGLTKEALADLTIARLKDEKAKQMSYGDNKAVEALDAEIEAVRRAATARDALDNKQASTTAADEATRAWQKTADDIERGLTDSLMRGFESGKSVVTSLRDYIVNAFKTMVIKIAVQPVVGAITSLIVGASPAASAASSAGGMFGNIGSAAGLFGSGFKAGIGSVFGEAGIAGGFSAGTTAIGAGNVAGGLGTLAGVAAPALAIKGLADAMKYTVEAKGGGLTATIGGASGLPSGSVGMFKEFEQKGGLGGGGTTTNRDWTEADKGVAAYIAANVQNITASNKAYADALGLTSDSIESFTKSIEINTTGLDAAGQKAAIDAELAKFSAEQISATYGAALASVAIEGETTAQTLGRLSTDLTSVNGVLASLGGTLYDVSVAGASAASGLAAAFGSLANFQAQTASLYQNFYTNEEQKANAVRGASAGLASAGITGFSTDQIASANREQIRAVVDQYATRIGTDEGDKQYAAVVAAANSLSSYVPAFEASANAATAATASKNSGVGFGYGVGSGLSDGPNFADELYESIRVLKLKEKYAKEDADFAKGTAKEEVARIEAERSSLTLQLEELRLNGARGGIYGHAEIYSYKKGEEAFAIEAKLAALDGSGGAGNNKALDAWQRATDAIVSTMKDLRVSLVEQGPDSFARLQSQFAIDVAKAQAGDLGAYEELQKLINPLVDAQKMVSGSGTEESLFVANLFQTLDQLTTRISGQSSFGSATPAAITSVPQAYQPPPVTGAATDADLREQNRILAAMLLSIQATATNTGKAATTLQNAAVGVQPLTTIAA